MRVMRKERRPPMPDDDSKKVAVIGNNFGIPEIIRSACEDIIFELRPSPPIFNDACVPSVFKNPLRGINIDREYELIKQKKSTLPARLRRLVVKRKETPDAG